MINTCNIDTPLGVATITAENDKLTGFWFVGQKYFASNADKTDMRGWTENYDYPVFKAVRKWIADYFAGKNPVCGFELNPRGTGFQKNIWELLLQIPYGQVVTYGELAGRYAKKMGIERMSAQAVGGAVGHNPISLLIPCHRVVGSNGSLTGYAGGIEKKSMLLALEGVNMSSIANRK